MLYKRLLPVIFAAILACSSYPAIAQKVIKLSNLDKEWSKDYPPFRIAGNLYYVGTYELAAYLIWTYPHQHWSG